MSQCARELCKTEKRYFRESASARRERRKIFFAYDELLADAKRFSRAMHAWVMLKILYAI